MNESTKICLHLFSHDIHIFVIDFIYRSLDVYKLDYVFMLEKLLNDCDKIFSTYLVS